MNFFSGFFASVINCFKSFILIFEKGLWPFLFYALGLWLITFILTLLGIAALSDFVSSWVSDYFKSIPEEGHWLSWARPYLTVSYVGFIVAVGLKIALWFISGTFTKYVTMIILSPMFTLLSEKTEEKICDTSFAFSFIQFTKDIGRGILISLRNMFIEYLIIIIVFILTIVFPISVIVTTPLLMVVSWYFTGFTILDYNCERHKYRVGESVRFVRANRGYACGIGFVYWLLSFFTFFPFSILAVIFGPAVCSVGGTVSFLDIKKQAR